LRLICPPAAIKSAWTHPGNNLNAGLFWRVAGYNAFAAKMASKNMMNHYRDRSRLRRLTYC
jgi:hypothetical protein